jgi:hypothetical protein
MNRAGTAVGAPDPAFGWVIPLISPNRLNCRPPALALHGSPSFYCCPLDRCASCQHMSSELMHGAYPCLHRLADLSLLHRAHRERRLWRAVIIIGSALLMVWVASTLQVMLSAGWRAARPPWRPKVFSCQWRFGDFNRDSDRWRQSGATCDQSLSRRALVT